MSEAVFRRRHGTRGSIQAMERRGRVPALLMGLAVAGAMLVTFVAIRRSLNLC